MKFWGVNCELKKFPTVKQCEDFAVDIALPKGSYELTDDQGVKHAFVKTDTHKVCKHGLSVLHHGVNFDEAVKVDLRKKTNAYYTRRNETNNYIKTKKVIDAFTIPVFILFLTHLKQWGPAIFKFIQRC
jgi:hypothetical protein